MTNAPEDGGVEQEDSQKFDLWDGRQTRVEIEADSGVFYQRMKAVTAISNEFEMEIGENGIHIRAIDPANVCAVDTTIPVEFQTDTKEFSVGVNSKEFDRSLIRASAGKQTQLIFKRIDTDAIVGTGNLMDYFQVFDPDKIDRKGKVPDYENENFVTVDAMKFKGAVSGVASAADGSIRFTAGDDGLLVEGEKVGKGYVYEWLIEADADDEIRAKFSYEYLSDITSAIPPEGEIILGLDRGTPLRIIVDDQTEYHLAPRLDSENLNEEEEEVSAE